MPAEILIMCPRCGRPQRAQGDHCIHCLATLAPAPAQAPSVKNDPVPDPSEPFLEADLGLGRRVLLSAKQLQWMPRQGETVIVDLAKLESVTLVTRPVWESLYIAALAALAFAVRAPWLVHAVLGALIVLALAACVLQKRYAFRLRLKDGREASLVLGIGARRSPVVLRIESVWGSLAPALTSLGVKCEPFDSAADTAGPSAHA